VKNYSIIRNLVNNPKTPVDISLHLLQRLITTDLKTDHEQEHSGDGSRDGDKNDSPEGYSGAELILG